VDTRHSQSVSIPTSLMEYGVCIVFEIILPEHHFEAAIDNVRIVPYLDAAVIPTVVALSHILGFPLKPGIVNIIVRAGGLPACSLVEGCKRNHEERSPVKVRDGKQ